MIYGLDEWFLGLMIAIIGICLFYIYLIWWANRPLLKDNDYDFSNKALDRHMEETNPLMYGRWKELKRNQKEINQLLGRDR